MTTMKHGIRTLSGMMFLRSEITMLEQTSTAVAETPIRAVAVEVSHSLLLQTLVATRATARIQATNLARYQTLDPVESRENLWQRYNAVSRTKMGTQA